MLEFSWERRVNNWHPEYAENSHLKTWQGANIDSPFAKFLRLTLQ